MKKIIIPAFILLMMGCAGQRQTQMEVYRKLTKDIDRKDPEQVKLAQVLWHEIVIDEKRYKKHYTKSN